MMPFGRSLFSFGRLVCRLVALCCHLVALFCRSKGHSCLRAGGVLFEARGGCGIPALSGIPRKVRHAGPEDEGIWGQGAALSATGPRRGRLPVINNRYVKYRGMTCRLFRPPRNNHPFFYSVISRSFSINSSLLCLGALVAQNIMTGSGPDSISCLPPGPLTEDALAGFPAVPVTKTCLNVS